MAKRNCAVIAFIAFILMMVGVRFSFNGLINFTRDGQAYYCYDKFDNEEKRDEIPLLNARGKYEKVELIGGVKRARKLIEDMRVTIVKREKVDNIEIIYGLSPFLDTNTTTTFGTINIMMAISGEKLSVGTPLLKGSY